MTNNSQDPTSNFRARDTVAADQVLEVIEEESAIILRCSRGLKVNLHRLRVLLPSGELQPSVEEVFEQFCRDSPQSIMRISW